MIGKKATATRRRSDKASRAWVILEQRREAKAAKAAAQLHKLLDAQRARDAAKAEKKESRKTPVKYAGQPSRMAEEKAAKTKWLERISAPPNSTPRVSTAAMEGGLKLAAARLDDVKDAVLARSKRSPAEDFEGKPWRLMDPNKLKPHPLAELLPKMTAEEYESLTDSIARNDQLDDVILLDGLILDGRHRVSVLRDLCRLARCVDYSLSMPAIEYVVAKASHRNMKESQKGCAAVLAEAEIAKEADRRQAAGTKADEGEKGKTSQKLGRLFGVGSRTVERAKAVYAADMDLFRKCFEGQEDLTRAVSEIVRRRKSVNLKAMATRANASPPDGYTWSIREGDCIQSMEAASALPVDLIIADPPYNIGVDYGGGVKADKLPRDVYLEFMRRWMAQCHRHLADDGTLVIIINWEWSAEHVMAAKDLGFRVEHNVWYETFGVNCVNRTNRTTRGVYRCMKHPKRATFNSEAMNRPSDRQAIHGDKRAVEAGKNWDDLLGLNPPIPRLNDNDPERLPWFPTQLPLKLIRPLVEAWSDPGDTVIDPFSGSGTTVAACVLTGRKAQGIEINPKFAADSRLRISGIVPDAK